MELELCFDLPGERAGADSLDLPQGEARTGASHRLKSTGFMIRQLKFAISNLVCPGLSKKTSTAYKKVTTVLKTVFEFVA